MRAQTVLNPPYIQSNRRSKHGKPSRKWITTGHKVYPNKTKTYGPSTSNFMKGNKRFESREQAD